MQKKTTKKEQDNSLLDYQKQLSTNEDRFNYLFKKMRPDLWALGDLLNETKVNPFVLMKVARQLKLITMGTRYGQVTISLEDGIVRFIRGEESDRLNEPAVLE